MDLHNMTGMEQAMDTCSTDRLPKRLGVQPANFWLGPHSKLGALESIPSREVVVCRDTQPVSISTFEVVLAPAAVNSIIMRLRDEVGPGSCS